MELAFRGLRVQDYFMFKNIGLPEILVILLVLVLLFGAKRIPELARSLGRSIGEFKKGREDGQSGEPKDDGAPKA
jgi:sec-independent protein translocase protein TatA